MTGKWKKPSEELMALLDTLVQPYNCTPRKMFGSPTYFVNNNMFTGVHEDVIFLRFSKEDQELILIEDPDIEHFEPLEGRKMREYMTLSMDFCREIPRLEKWLNRSYQYVSSLPPKIKKKK